MWQKMSVVNLKKEAKDSYSAGGPAPSSGKATLRGERVSGGGRCMRAGTVSPRPTRVLVPRVFSLCHPWGDLREEWSSSAREEEKSSSMSEGLEDLSEEESDRWPSVGKWWVVISSMCSSILNKTLILSQGTWGLGLKKLFK